MTGKAYTLREMKAIVDYLTEHKAYGEVRGRKMWIDFANTQLTNRSWQSLKETFRKRILPDLHNPYYKLTMEQVNSFRQGCDVADVNKPKLEIHTISDDSSSSHSNAEKQTDNEPTSKTEEKNAGEDIICSKITSKTRSSADTVILDHYETTEDIQRDLESPSVEANVDFTKSKSLRDCITYSEPLTPMLQEVLDDFASEPESDEPQMQIVENTVAEPDNSESTEQISKSPTKPSNTESIVAADVAKNAKGLSADIVEEVLLSEMKEGNQSTRSKHLSPKKTRQDSVTDLGNAQEINLVIDEENKNDAKENTAENKCEEILQEATIEILEHTGCSNITNVEQNISSNNKVGQGTSEKDSQNHSNITPDSLLPNNPEGFGKRTSNESEVQTQKDSAIVFESSDEIGHKRSLRKRVASQDTAKSSDNKKKKVESKVITPVTEKVNGSVPDTKSDSVDLKNDEIIVKRNSPNIQLAKKPEVKEKKNTKRVSRSKSKSPGVTTTQTKQNENIPILFEQPSTSKNYEDNLTSPNTVEVENPCLKNVSLFDEQFNKLKYTSESSDTEIIPKAKETEGSNSKNNDVVVLKSNSDSADNNIKLVSLESKRHTVVSSKKRRDVALANAFGFSSGVVGTNARSRLNRAKEKHNKVHNNNGTNSSDWSSESESEQYVSPPRGRKNKQTRKFLKPQSARILSLEEEGGLFVMHRNKVYPLVRDGKMVKNYLKYLPESDTEEEESYWKLKYVEEKKKSDELKRILEETKESRSRESRSPILTSKPLRNTRTKSTNQQPQEPENTDKEMCSREQFDKNVDTPANRTEEKIKIKFTKNNEEVHLEGHWPQIHPVLEQVVNIFHKEAEVSGLKAREKERKASHSGYSTPVIMVDPEAHEKVDHIEKQIFQEIEERDREEIGAVHKTGLLTVPTTAPAMETSPQNTDQKEQTKENGPENVTKRTRGRPRKASSTASSPAKKPRTGEGQGTKDAEDNTKKPRTPEGQNTKIAEDNTKKPRTPEGPRTKIAEIDTNKSKSVAEAETKTNRTSTRRTATPRKVLNETVNTEPKTVQTRRSRSRTNKTSAEAENNEDDVRYKFPPNTRQQSVKKTAKSEEKPQKSTAKAAKIFSSPDNFSLNSLDSTQGYQDSDMSPIRTDLRKKKLNNRSTYTIRNKNLLRRNSRRRSHPYLHFDASNDSSNSSTSAPMFTARNSSLDSEEYRSESYQLLMAKPKQAFILLERIDETCSIGNNVDSTAHFNATSKRELRHVMSDVASSSNVSLPLSPELSVVENLSVSKDKLSSLGDYPTINETQCNHTSEQFCSKYMISGVDVSIPLMQQDCDLESCNIATLDQNSVSRNVVTDSLLSKINTCHIRDKTPVTGMLNQKLQNLLLESAKKIGEGLNNDNMDVDNTDVATELKSKSIKRCSTPRKKKVAKQLATPKVAVVEEERVEACSFSGRNSCPPILQVFPNENSDLYNPINISNLTINPDANKKKREPRKKKDVIKVKILKPKSSKDKLNKPVINKSKLSVYTDSGINDSASSGFLHVDDSVDLIHNHSDTCLHANECVGDSIEFVSNSKSVISLSSDSDWQDPAEFEDGQNISPDAFGNNAQDLNMFCHDNQAQNTSDTVYHSPVTELSNNSLLTDDLSDGAQRPPSRTSNWYLFSEDENTNMLPKDPDRISSASSSGASIRQIFPVVCTVPDLSTITEMSKENDDSRKPTLDTDADTRDGLDSLGAFDSNF